MERWQKDHFQKDYTFGDSYVKAAEYNIDNARHLLAQSGWKDTDGDDV